MKILIIIGNGFDLAHGLKTGYPDFIKYLADEQHIEGTLNGMPLDSYDYNALKKELELSIQNTENRFKFKNGFAGILLHNYSQNNWSDIESIYFEELNKCKDNKSEPKQLNDDFEAVKKHLSDYLLIEEKKSKKMQAYENFFSSFNSPNTLILNFNYTRTIKQHYSNSIQKSQLIHIHGELENEGNPIIFGYAATHKESRELLDPNNIEFMKNIKKHLYKRTSNENSFLKFLNTSNHNNEINVVILGHSCGLSDNLILNEIFNHKYVASIQTFYHNDYNNYFELQVNIDRIMANDQRFKELIIPFDKSCPILQFNDEKSKQKEFDEFSKRLGYLYSPESSIPLLGTRRMNS